LVFLRARHVATSIGIFLTSDTWPINLEVPSSLQKWVYVYDNPINNIDPNGHSPQNVPCGTEGYLYCQLDDPKYFGVSIDVSHFYSSWGLADTIMIEIDLSKVKEGRTFPLRQKVRSLPIVGGFLYEYSRMYRATIPAGISESIRNRVGLGIFMDFQYGFETYQSRDPRCRLPTYGALLGPCGSFANEDLPSDYLGYVARAMGHSRENALTLILKELGGGHATKKNEPVYRGYGYEAFICSVVGFCDEDNPMNRCSLFKVYDPEKNIFSYVPWPSSILDISPIGPGQYWERVGDYNVDWFVE
jgi:hypothetical protein